jgi:hypothetical protein
LHGCDKCHDKIRIPKQASPLQSVIRGPNLN